MLKLSLQAFCGEKIFARRNLQKNTGPPTDWLTTRLFPPEHRLRPTIPVFVRNFSGEIFGVCVCLTAPRPGVSVAHIAL